MYQNLLRSCVYIIVSNYKLLFINFVIYLCISPLTLVRQYSVIIDAITMSFCRAAEILYCLVMAYHSERNGLDTWHQWYEDVLKMRRNSALLQHHDAITGTTRQSVLLSYLDT